MRAKVDIKMEAQAEKARQSLVEATGTAPSREVQGTKVAETEMERELKSKQERDKEEAKQAAREH